MKDDVVLLIRHNMRELDSNQASQNVASFKTGRLMMTIIIDSCWCKVDLMCGLGGWISPSNKRESGARIKSVLPGDD